MSNFFFIHTFKNMGTTIYHQLPTCYFKRFYGMKTFRQWELENNQKLNTDQKEDTRDIDHIPIDELYELGILNGEDLIHRQFIAIIRDPIERFLSICNFGRICPEVLLSRIENSTKPNPLFYQYLSFKTKYDIDLTIIDMRELHLIKKWFMEHGVILKLGRKNALNRSTKLFKNECINEKVKNRIYSIFKKDIELYNNVKDNGGIIEKFKQKEN